MYLKREDGFFVNKADSFFPVEGGLAPMGIDAAEERLAAVEALKRKKVALSSPDRGTAVASPQPRVKKEKVEDTRRSLSSNFDAAVRGDAAAAHAETFAGQPAAAGPGDFCGSSPAKAGPAAPTAAPADSFRPADPGASCGSKTPEVSSSPILDALEKLTSKINVLTLKVDDVKTNAVTRKDLSNLQEDMRADAAIQIGEAVNPLKAQMEVFWHDNKALRTDLTAVQKKLAEGGGVSSGNANSPASVPKETKVLLNSLDPALRRVAFLGFPTDPAQAQKRVQALEAYIAEKLPMFKAIDIDHVYTGPRSSRKLTGVTYVEFSNADKAAEFLKKFDKDSKTKLGSFEVSVRPARTKLNSARNWALKQAADVLKEAPGVDKAKVVIQWMEQPRRVDVAGAPAFVQQSDDLHCTLCGAYPDLVLK